MSFLDMPLEDIKVQPITPTKYETRFNSSKIIDNAKVKTIEIIKQNANALADWILNTEIDKKILPTKIQNLINMVKNTEYSKKPVNPQNRYISDEGKLLKLSCKRVTAFKNNAVEYNLTIRNNMDPLKQILLLNSRKTYLISKKIRSTQRG